MTGAAKRGLLGSLSWILLAGALVMLWFVVLSGVTNHTPLNRIYFLKADTSGIQGARPISQWTYFQICDENNVDCGKSFGALPFGSAWSPNANGVPPALIGNHAHNTTSSYYYYMWRFGWTFYIIGFIFANFAILSGLLSCFRLVAAATGFLALISLFWMTLAASLMTAVFVKARDQFQNQGRYAHVGPYAFGFTWASTVLLFLASFLFLGGALIGRKKRDVTAPYTKEVPYGTGNTNYPAGNQGFPTSNVQSGYTGDAAPVNQAGGAGHPIQGEAPPTMRGENARRGLFPKHREPQGSVAHGSKEEV